MALAPAAVAEQSRADFRRLGSLPLPSGLKIKLARSGYEVSHDLRGVDARALARDLDVSEEDAKLIFECALGEDSSVAKEGVVEQQDGPVTRPPGGRGYTLLELLKREQELGSIVTFCAQVDEMLGGGVPLGKMTELCGVAGAGKTQFCMQLAVDVTIPEEFGGVGGQAVYVDTEGSLVVERLAEMAAATVQHLGDLTQDMEEGEDKVEQQRVVKGYTFDQVVHSVHCLRCCNYAELLAVVHLLPGMVEENPAIKLVVIDSVASLFRTEFSDARVRTRVLNGMAQNLIKLATEKGIAVVLTNQMVARSFKSGSGVGSVSRSQLIPALGESWGHSCTARLVLLRHNGTRKALLYKSPSKREMCVPFQIAAIGVRDVEVDPAVSPVGVSPDGMLLDDLAVDLGEQEMKELFMNHEDSGCDGEEVGGLPRSKRPHLEDPLDRDSNPQLTHHAHAHQTGL